MLRRILIVLTALSAGGAIALAADDMHGWRAPVVILSSIAALVLGAMAIISDGELGTLRREHDNLVDRHERLADEQYDMTLEGQTRALIAAKTGVPPAPRPDR